MSETTSVSIGSQVESPASQVLKAGQALPEWVAEFLKLDRVGADGVLVRGEPTGRQSHEGEPQVLGVDDVASAVRGGITDGFISLIGAGVDWFRVNAFGRALDGERFAELFALRQQAVAGGESVRLTVGGVVWEVMPYSDGKGSNNFAVVLRCGHVKVGISCRGGRDPVAFAEASGRFCAGRAVGDVEEALRRVVLSFGVDVDTFKPGRVDVYCDVRGVSVHDVHQAHVSDRCITRARSWKCEGRGRKATGFCAGVRGNPVYLRIYDKAEELRQDEGKRLEWLAANGLDEMPDEPIIRIEFELLPEFWREVWVCKSSAECLEMLPTVAQYLFENWFRVTEKPVDRTNTVKARTAVWWDTCKRFLVDAVRGAVVSGRVRKEQKKPAVSRVVKSIVGGVASLCALMGVSPASWESALGMVRARVDGIQLAEMREKVESRVILYESSERLIVQAFAKSADCG